MSDAAGTMTSGAEALVETLRVQQVEYLFCSPIGACGPVWEALAGRQAAAEAGLPTYINCRHELLAVGLAAGYFKATGRAQICMLPTGLGVLNGSIGLHDALQERVAMTVITPDTRSFGLDPSCDPGPEWPFLLTDLAGPARDAETVVKWSHASNVALDLVSNLQRAMYFAASAPRGPALLSVPLDVLMGALPKETIRRLDPTPVQASAQTLEYVAGKMAFSRNPLILTGHAGRERSARRALLQIAELLGAPVFEPLSPSYCCVPRNHALHGRGSPSAEMLRDADCILVAGSNGPWYPARTPLNPDATVIVLEEDPLRPRAPVWGYRSDVCVAGDIGLNLELLANQLTDYDSSSAAARASRWEEINRTAKQAALAQARVDAQRCAGIHAAHLFDALHDALPEDSTIVDEIICQHGYMLDVLFREKPFEQIRGYGGALGQGIAQALGVKLGRPDHVVVALVGDGAFNYSPIAAYFGMAQQYSVPILVIVCNNHGYQSQKWLTQGYFPTGAAVRNDNIMGSVIAPEVDYSALAVPFGGHAQRVTRAAELGGAIRSALAALRDGRFALLDVHVVP